MKKDGRNYAERLDKSGRNWTKANIAYEKRIRSEEAAKSAKDDSARAPDGVNIDRDYESPEQDYAQTSEDI
jgi:hypothetical protein